MRVLAIVGSLGASSSNKALVATAASAAPAGVEVAVFDRLGTLPFFDPDLGHPELPADAREDAAHALGAVLALRRAILASDALLIACPEYGHSLPGALKNAIDWLIGTGELERKVVAITASVPHTERGRRGLAALAQTLGAVSAQIAWREPIVRGTEAASLPALFAALVRVAEEAVSDPLFSQR